MQMKDSARRHHELARYNFAAVLPGDSVAALVVSNGVLNFLNIYNTLLVVRLILTWFPEPPQVIVNPLRYASLSFSSFASNFQALQPFTRAHTVTCVKCVCSVCAYT